MSDWFSDPTNWEKLAPAIFSSQRVGSADVEVQQLAALLRDQGFGDIFAARVLDLPCGVGRMSSALAKRGSRVLGVDLMPKFLQRAQMLAERAGVTVEWMQGDMRNVEMPAGAFDFALNYYTSIGYSCRESDDVQTLENFRRALKPGGVLVIDTMSREIVARTYSEFSYFEADGFLVEHRTEILEDFERIRTRVRLIRDGDDRTAEYELSLYSAGDLKRMLRAAIPDDQVFRCARWSALRLNCKAAHPLCNLPGSFMNILVTGAAGFIGSNLVRALLAKYEGANVVSFDALTYAGHLESLAHVLDFPNHVFVHGDINDGELLAEVFSKHKIQRVFHLAAESHVDRSILAPMKFVTTNVQGTATLLQVATAAWQNQSDCKFLHVSTDEVFGSLGANGFFEETTPYAPHSAYSASKASSDHFARAWHDTFGLPTLVTNCTNNYGPFQFPEKLLPVVITRAIEQRPVPVYGQGVNVRDWLFVSDHCDALMRVMDAGQVGETYCIGGNAEVKNLDLVHIVLAEVDKQLGRPAGTSAQLIEFVQDRPGHDFRYAMNISKIKRTLGWEPTVTLTAGIERTVRWYLENQQWCAHVRSGESREFEKQWYSENRK